MSRRQWLIIFWIAGAVVAWLPTEARAQMSGMGAMGGPPGGKKDQGDTSDQLPTIDPKIGDDVNMSFAHAEVAFRKKEWLEAIAYYQHVRAKFSYNVSLCALAQLRLGDIAFNRDKWAEAKEYYKEFVKMHPNHDEVDYAAFQIGFAAYKDIPGDMFLQPPSSERDQSEVRSARKTMAEFLTGHSRSKYIQQAREIVVTCDNKLAAHEMYVESFYYDRGKWQGAVLRGEALAKTYPDAIQAPGALLMALAAHAKLKQAAEQKLMKAEAAKDAAAAQEQTTEIQTQRDAAQKDFEMLQALNPNPSVLDKGRAALLVLR